jgi:hypothetical protein
VTGLAAVADMKGVVVVLVEEDGGRGLKNNE